MPEIEEYKDAKGKHRIRQIADNGEISDSTHQGYFNLIDAREGKIKTSLAYLKHYLNDMDINQLQDLSRLGNKANKLGAKLLAEIEVEIEK